MYRSQAASIWSEYRTRVYITAALLGFSFILLRLFFLQVINRPEFLKLAATNRIKAVAVEPVRGTIYDRNGKLLVENRPAYTLFVQPWLLKNQKDLINELAVYLDIDSKTLTNRIGQRGWNTFTPAVIQRDLSPEKLAILEAVRLDFPSISFALEAKRSYLHTEAVHSLGYVSEKSDTDKEYTKSSTRFIGKNGVEQVYDQWLCGTSGVAYYQVDAAGRVMGEVNDPQGIQAKSGWDLTLTIDAELQLYANELMAERSGGVVAIDPNNGDVLVLLSTPDYDPDLFSGVLPVNVWEDLQSDSTHPLLNRCVQGQYPPGSTYKMAILAAAIDEGIATETFTVRCLGALQLGRRPFKCWKAGGHGEMDRLNAIQQSCDVYFYTLGLQLGVTKMAEYMRKFGFGSPTNIDIPNELNGIVPSTEYLDNKYGKGLWTKGQLANISIGQGDVLATPLQLAVYTCGIATGKIVEPRMVKKLVNPDTHESKIIERSFKEIEISEETMNVLREGMRQVVNEPLGTAYWLKREKIVIAGKTGTSQNPHGEDHGLFVAYAPYDKPQIAISVVVEHGEHGSTAAAPVAVKLIERYLQTKKSASESTKRELSIMEEGSEQ